MAKAPSRLSINRLILLLLLFLLFLFLLRLFLLESIVDHLSSLRSVALDLFGLFVTIGVRGSSSISSSSTSIRWRCGQRCEWLSSSGLSVECGSDSLRPTSSTDGAMSATCRGNWTLSSSGSDTSTQPLIPSSTPSSMTTSGEPSRKSLVVLNLRDLTGERSPGRSDLTLTSLWPHYDLTMTYDSAQRTYSAYFSKILIVSVQLLGQVFRLCDSLPLLFAIKRRPYFRRDLFALKMSHRKLFYGEDSDSLQRMDRLC